MLVEHAYPQSDLAVGGPNERTVAFFAESCCRVYAEVGVYKGYTATAIAEHLAGEGELHLFDYQDRLEPVVDALRGAGHTNVVAYPNSRRLMDSYNWSLMRLLAEHEQPLFDYVFLDGAHTWAHDALAFCLVDRLLRPGGYVDFDDYAWTLGNSPSMRPEVFPDVRRLYSDEQIEEAQVALIVELLVKRRPDYAEVVANKIFRKDEGEEGPGRR